HRVAVRRLRVREPRSDAVATRLRIERELAHVELRPRSLPPGAILLVRSLRTRIAEAPAALAELLRIAGRPAHGPVPETRASVWFARRAELLACLAEDALRGIARERWWWALVSTDLTTDGVVATWLVEPEALPAAFSRLADRGLVVEFASAIDGL